jgi:hypothetical protein
MTKRPDVRSGPYSVRSALIGEIAAARLGIELLDHIIINDGSYFSFREMGRL